MNDANLKERALSVGTLIKSPTSTYIVVDVLGAGGFGITYKVVRQRDGAMFAMKEYFPDKLCERSDGTRMSYLKTNANSIETGLKDFITEAERLDRENISHPNIVAVLEVFKANNTAYYLMEFIDGVNLRQYVKKNGKPLTVEQALGVMRPVLQAVNLLHINSLTHLDIKHDNIVLTFEGEDTVRPVLIDFGQSKHYDKHGDATSTLTNAGCSDGFAPLEQYVGLSVFTPQADVYALCATLLFLLTGKQPVKSSEITPAIITNMLGANVPERIKSAILNGMRREKDDRTQSVAALASQLGIDISTQTQGGNVTRLLSIKQHKSFDYHKLIKPALFVAVLCVAVGLVILLVNRPQPSQTELNTETTGLATDSTGAKDIAQKPENTAAESQSANETLTPAQIADSLAPTPKIVTQPTPSKTDKNDELFAKARTIADLKNLADKGYKKAYAPLAEKYFMAKNYSGANTYARKALSSNVGKKEAISVIEKLDVLGFYDNGENGGKPRY